MSQSYLRLLEYSRKFGREWSSFDSSKHLYILGAAKTLLTCNHSNLAKYLDIQRGKHQRIAVVGESWSNNLRHMDQWELMEERLLSISKLALLASAYLNQPDEYHQPPYQQ